jgi:DMSO/TMAO reductase YedYZ molybdopterin-dependent catalytic subunit
LDSSLHKRLAQRRAFMGAAALAGGHALGWSQAQAQMPSPGAAASAAAPRRVHVKSDARLLNIGATVRSGRYWDYSTFITPVEAFFVRNHYATPTAETHPQLAPSRWQLKLHGNAIERPLVISYEQLRRMPSRSLVATLECHGNARTLFWEQQGMADVAGGNWVMGAVGQAEWQFVPISHLLGLAGLRPGARSALLWSGVDGSDMGRPMPVSELLARGDDIGLCFQMNGNDLSPDHGAPVRWVVPGWGGTAWIKWLTEIRIDRHAHWCRLNTRGEVYIGPEYRAPEVGSDDEFIGSVTAADVQGPMVSWMPIKTLLTLPLVIDKSPSLPADYPLKRGEKPLLAAGMRRMSGYAWAPRHGIREVLWRVDGGAWQRAELLPSNLGRYTWVRFEFPWMATAGEHVLETCGVDASGERQPATVPFNKLGMANGAIPRFAVNVV